MPIEKAMSDERFPVDGPGAPAASGAPAGPAETEAAAFVDPASRTSPTSCAAYAQTMMPVATSTAMTAQAHSLSQSKACLGETAGRPIVLPEPTGEAARVRWRGPGGG